MVKLMLDLKSLESRKHLFLDMRKVQRSWRISSSLSAKRISAEIAKSSIPSSINVISTFSYFALGKHRYDICIDLEASHTKWRQGLESRLVMRLHIPDIPFLGFPLASLNLYDALNQGASWKRVKISR